LNDQFSNLNQSNVDKNNYQFKIGGNQPNKAEEKKSERHVNHGTRGIE